MLPQSLRSLVKFGIVAQAEARHFPMKLLCSNFYSALSETVVFLVLCLCAEEGLGWCSGGAGCWAWLTGIHLE